MTQAVHMDDGAASVGLSRSSGAPDVRWSDALAIVATFPVGLPAIILAHEGRWLLAVPIYIGLVMALGAYSWAERARTFAHLPFNIGVFILGGQFIAQIWIE